MINKVILLGRLGKKPEIRHSTNGTACGELRLALNSKRKQGDEYVDQTDWVTVKVFGKNAENCGKYLDKGRIASVEGKLATNNYTNKEGVKIYSMDIIGERVQFVPSSNTAQDTEPSKEGNYGKLEKRVKSEWDDIDVPF